MEPNDSQSSTKNTSSANCAEAILSTMEMWTWKVQFFVIVLYSQMGVWTTTPILFWLTPGICIGAIFASNCAVYILLNELLGCLYDNANQFQHVFVTVRLLAVAPLDWFFRLINFVLLRSRIHIFWPEKREKTIGELLLMFHLIIYFSHLQVFSPFRIRRKNPSDNAERALRTKQKGFHKRFLFGAERYSHNYDVTKLIEVRYFSVKQHINLTTSCIQLRFDTLNVIQAHLNRLPSFHFCFFCISASYWQLFSQLKWILM